MTDVRYLIHSECDSLKEMLLEKNAKYGNSATEPLRIFSRAHAAEQLLVRIDDKLSRLRTMGIVDDDASEDAVQDLLGYLILLRVARRKAQLESESIATVNAHVTKEDDE